MKSRAYRNAMIGIIVSVALIGSAWGEGRRTLPQRGQLNGRLSAQHEIEDLMSCYAYSFDAIARATDAVPVADLLSDENIYLDPNFAEGLDRFRSCTTEDWFIEAFLVDGTQIIAEGDIPPGALPWVNLVNIFARSDGQTNSQHLFGSFSNTVDGTTGTVKAYASITTMFEDAETTTGTSTYISDVVFERGKWLLKKTTLIIN